MIELYLSSGWPRPGLSTAIAVQCDLSCLELSWPWECRSQASRPVPARICNVVARQVLFCFTPNVLRPPQNHTILAKPFLRLKIIACFCRPDSEELCGFIHGDSRHQCIEKVLRASRSIVSGKLCLQDLYGQFQSQRKRLQYHPTRARPVTAAGGG